MYKISFVDEVPPPQHGTYFPPINDFELNTFSYIIRQQRHFKPLCFIKQPIPADMQTHLQAEQAYALAKQGRYLSSKTALSNLSAIVFHEYPLSTM